MVFGGVGSWSLRRAAVPAAGGVYCRFDDWPPPEYLGKKRRSRDEINRAGDSGHPGGLLLGTALALMTEAGRSIFNPGIHGFGEVLYAVSSAANNSRQRLCRLSANFTFLELPAGVLHVCGRFGDHCAGVGDCRIAGE